MLKLCSAGNIKNNIQIADQPSCFIQSFKIRTLIHTIFLSTHSSKEVFRLCHPNSLPICRYLLVLIFIPVNLKRSSSRSRQRVRTCIFKLIHPKRSHIRRTKEVEHSLRSKFNSFTQGGRFSGTRLRARRRCVRSCCRRLPWTSRCRRRAGSSPGTRPGSPRRHGLGPFSGIQKIKYLGKY